MGVGTSRIIGGSKAYPTSLDFIGAFYCVNGEMRI